MKPLIKYKLVNLTKLASFFYFLGGFSMKGIRLKVISCGSPEDFESEVNCFLSDLDAQNLSYEINFKEGRNHCAYISYSNPKRRVLRREDHEAQYCNKCQYFEREYKGTLSAYCYYHKRSIKFGGYCCEEFYKNFEGC
jgi:hypothetical protein